MTSRVASRLIPVLLAALACGLLAVPAGAAVVSSEVQQSPAEVRAYWTPERMRDAEPFDLPAGGQTATRATPAPPATARATEIPATRRSSIYAFEPGAETSFPQSVHGKIFLTIPATENHPELQGSCSGTVVASRLQNVVFTAGHCVKYPGEPASTNLTFVPGYRDGSEPLGEWPATTLLAPQEWADDADANFDVAIAQLAAPIEVTLGARGIAFNKPPKTAYKLFGYPAEPSPTYDGERLIECDSSFFGLEFGFTHPFSNIIYPCDMHEGSSGGGWVNPDGKVVSVTSHFYADPSLAGQLAGPYFGDAVKRLYNAAGGSAQCPPAQQALKAAKKRMRKARKAARRSSSPRAKKRLRKAHRHLGKARSRRDSYC